MKKAAGEGYATATDLADWLVRTLKMPFRDAHHVTGRIVAKAAEAGVPLHKLPLAAMQAIEPRITRGRVRRAVGRQLGEEPHEFRRHGARKTCGAQAKKWLKQAGKGDVLMIGQWPIAGWHGSLARPSLLMMRASPRSAL